MTEEVDIWRVADLLVKRHGADDAMVVAQRADECIARGDSDRLVHYHHHRTKSALRTDP